MSTETIQRPIRKEKNIEFFKPTLSREDLKGVLECLVEEHLSTGEIVERFEKTFCHTFKIKYAISSNSLTSAYHLALLALGVKAGDSVLLSSYSPISALDAIFLIQAKPVIVDLKRNSFHPCPEEFLRKKNESGAKFALFDHSFGSLIRITDYSIEGLEVIEDFTEAIGATSETITVGKQTKIAICGLSAENIITTGNGAMIITAESQLANVVKSYKSGTSAKRNFGEPKYDYNLVDYQAALGIEQLSKLGVILERKKKIASAYLQAVQNSRLETFFQNPNEDTFQRFPIVVSGQNYEEIQRYFKSIHIGTQRTVEEPLHRVLEENHLEYPNAERLFQRGHCIPIYPNLTKDNVQRIATAIRRIY
ncbi:DegT/DnrJ/EryC1/StrS aminotransferase family protein [Leptospira levettii]|uniref:DegT/DnrJ/EryC1/StrS family aminotransferase n=1 Tax=Leptospira levettii TaxID=2023178 RepID=UPI000C29ED18|nr:DegT/DnrJ/EryC1/StrS aminotransferase family protein [Leptospira levettii]PKA28275.1 pyridoxal phosphate-dependent aminotransferase [Leptospira sp. mixed culture ATI2-C-A1]MCW7473635.1 DegT/DnrJ/EryC1/StrS aminotransferase family protein [Leptospira levettii]MCW7495142.1 DegT/DnrJ/EryC1/StrS aminotransferase family protein [Leptospira levettii]MCW7507982.1 DegT/DnrJ/EryC1/StrS aminotransferase family protein [Leptospira levettii]MCW7519072.1 DegT/DnrJ/EryC1/StrS aminotransferase family prot